MHRHCCSLVVLIALLRTIPLSRPADRFADTKAAVKEHSPERLECQALPMVEIAATAKGTAVSSATNSSLGPSSSPAGANSIRWLLDSDEFHSGRMPVLCFTRVFVKRLRLQVPSGNATPDISTLRLSLTVTFPRHSSAFLYLRRDCRHRHPGCQPPQPRGRGACPEFGRL